MSKTCGVVFSVENKCQKMAVNHRLPVMIQFTNTTLIKVFELLAKEIVLFFLPKDHKGRTLSRIALCFSLLRNCCNCTKLFDT